MMLVPSADDLPCQTIRSLRRLSEDNLETDARQRLLTAFRDWRRSSD
jgi:hypothetical protein